MSDIRKYNVYPLIVNVYLILKGSDITKSIKYTAIQLSPREVFILQI